MSQEIPKQLVTTLVTQVMRIQKQFAHEQLGARNDRRNEIKKIVNNLVSSTETERGN